ncbi:hypothetical protein PHYC_03782 [Phycisphaerales bacterium]|nr:hypothetical protein PHYC_03782 [Phycisphaerales bacterium]
MTFRGTIENGRLVLEGGARLPNGTPVDVTIRGTARGKARAARKSDPLGSIASRAVRTGVRDLADQHDHYAYGTPKKKTARKAKGAARSSRRAR